MYKDYLKKYAEVVVKIGLNLQPKQQLVIRSDYEASDLIEAIMDVCYNEVHSGKVNVFISSPKLSRKAFEVGSMEALSTINDYETQVYKDMADKEMAMLMISCPDPLLYKGLDSKKIAEISKQKAKVFAPLREEMDEKHLAWNICAYVNDAWAAAVYPDLDLETAKTKLWDMVYKACRIYDPDPIEAWQTHIDTLKKRANYLNDAKIKSFHYKSSKTDFTISMTDKYLFSSAGDINNYNMEYVPNIPTEEVFSSPDKNTANGILYATLPLNVRGNLVKDFWFKFKDGQVIDYGAKEGKEALGYLLDSDPGAKRLGEIALVPINSQISNLNTLFLSTLFDENARCHFALGKSFPECYTNGYELSKEARKKVGLNDSVIHVDFMVGSEDLDIVATTVDGKEIVIFKNGNFAF